MTILKRSVFLCTALFSTLDLVTPLGRCNEPADLKKILQDESAGECVNRSLPTDEIPRDPFTAWHAGMVKQMDEWKAFDQLTKDKKENEYVAKRAELENVPQRHRALAKWCILNQLPDRARAHYFALLVSAPNDAEARQFLGHVLVGDSWVDRKELASAQATMRQKLNSLDDWVPKIKSIVSDLQSGKSKVMSKALDTLDAIDSDAALPSLEIFASSIDDDLAKPLIRKIASFRSRESCLALVRIALAHPSAEIRAVSAETIRKYPKSHYIPELLSMLADETHIESRLVMQPNGTVGLETLLHNELREKKQIQRAQKVVNVVSVFSSSHSTRIDTSARADVSYWSEFWKVPKENPASLGTVKSHRTNLANETSAASSRYVPAVVLQNAADNLAEQAKQQHRSVEKSNRDSKEVSHQVCSLLRMTSGLDFEDDPKQWWSWWNDYNERYQMEKPTAYSYDSKRENIVVASFTSRSEYSNREQDLGAMVMQYSCLVPGTPVHTSTGLVPIEKIQVGDMVLSQDIETAELTLKPVMLTTIRPPKSTIKIATSGDTIEATGGHLWWVSGRGWVKTRDLKIGMTLHTVTGTASVAGLEANPTPQQTHNLIVDGFHTYFVGQERVLSYDNSLVKPTLRQLPGYGQTADAAFD